MQKRTTILTLGLIAIFFILPACPKSQQSTRDSNSLIFWHWMTDRDKAFKTLADKFKEETGINVVVRLHAPSDAYSQNVSVGAQTDSLPDIYGILDDSKTIASFIKAGHVEKLDSYLGSGPGSWKERFYAEDLSNNYFPPENSFGVAPGYYGIPIDVTTIPMIYNKRLFEKAGLNPEEPPQTWEEFIEAGKALRKAGVIGFTSGWAETWLIQSMATDLAHNLMGSQKVMDTFAGKVPYTDEDWIEVFTAFEAMHKAGFADPSLVTLVNKYAEQSFASERSGMTFNGSWAVNVYGKMNPNLDYGVFRVPALGQENPRTVWGAAGSVFNVNAKSEHKDKAVQFLKWLTEKEQAAFLLNETKNLPAIRGLDEGISPVLADFAKMMEDSIHPSRFDHSEEPRVLDVFGKGIQAILIGEKTPQVVSKEIQAMKDKVSKRAI